MIPTANSNMVASDSGIVTFQVSTTIPTSSSSKVCPSPQNNPTTLEARRLGRSATTVDTAARWSASNACRNPNTKPRLRMVKTCEVNIYSSGNDERGPCVDTHRRRSSSSRVHLQVGVFTKSIDLDQSVLAQPQTLQGLAFFG